jgi:ATP-dependent exoDNAse (exonuclease V) alpha subunit
MCAPTDRAAKRMNEATGLEAKTIHRGYPISAPMGPNNLAHDTARS